MTRVLERISTGAPKGAIFLSWLACAWIPAGCDPSQSADLAGRDSWFARAEAHLANRQYSEAERALTQSVKADANFAHGHYKLGVARYQQSAVTLGSLAVDREKLCAALDAIERSIEIEPNQPEAHFIAGLAYERLHKLDSAAECFTQAIEFAPSHARAHLRRGVVRVRSGRRSDGERDLIAAASLAPEDSEAHYHLGLLRQRDADWNGSAAEFRRAIELNPDDPTPWFPLSNVLRRLGRAGEADSALAHFRKHSTSEAEKLAAKTHSGETSQQLARATRERPNDATAWHRLAILHAKKSNWPAAETALNEALRLAPGNTEMRCDLGGVLLSQGKHASASEHLLAVLSRDPQHERANYTLALTQARSGERDAARRTIQEVLDRNAEHSKARELLLALGGEY